jgi:hypothetical protein
LSERKTPEVAHWGWFGVEIDGGLRVGGRKKERKRKKKIGKEMGTDGMAAGGPLALAPAGHHFLLASFLLLGS